MEEHEINTIYDPKENRVYVTLFDGENLEEDFFLDIKKEKPSGVKIIIIRPHTPPEEYKFKNEN